MSHTLRYCQSCRAEVECEESGVSIVCTACGLEVEQAEVSVSLEHLEKSYAENRNRVSETSGGRSFLGNNRGANRPIINRKQDYKNRIWGTVRRLCKALGQSDEFTSEVKQMANLVLNSAQANPGCTKVIPACIYAVARKRKSSLSILDVADACSVTPFLIGRWYRRLLERVGLEAPDEHGPALMVDNCVCILINDATYAKHLSEGEKSKLAVQAKQELSDSGLFGTFGTDELVEDDWNDKDAQGGLGQLRQRVTAHVQRVIKMASDEMLVTGRHPGPVAAAATLLVIRSNPETVHFAAVEPLLALTHCSITTIEKRISEMRSLLFQAARATLPWAAGLTIFKLDEMMPMIVSHLEAEAKVKAAKLRFDALQAAEDANNAQGKGSLLLSPPVTPAKTMLPKIVTKSSMTPTSSSLPSVTATPLSTRPPSPDRMATSDSSISTLEPSSPKMDVTAESSITTSAPSPAGPRKIIIKLAPARLAQILATAPPMPPAPAPVVKQELTGAEPIIDKTPKIPIKAVKVKVKKEKKPVVRPPVIAPAYAKNSSMKAKRAEQVKRAKWRLAKLAHSLPPEEVQAFGLASFREMNYDPADPIAKEPANSEDDAQIEKLLMQGVNEENIIEGYLGTQLEALDSKYNAVTEYFIDDTHDHIRTSAEVAILQEMEAALASDTESDGLERG